jgi:hypothetical protein
MESIIPSNERRKRLQALRRRWPCWRLLTAFACFLVFFFAMAWYGMTGNVLRSLAPVGTGLTQALIFMAGLPIALATGIGPYAREHKTEAFVGVGVTLSMLYICSQSIAERYHVDLAFSQGPFVNERVEFVLTHFETGRRRAQIPQFMSPDGDRSWRPPMVGVDHQHIGLCVTLTRRIASDGTRLIEGQDDLTSASLHICPRAISVGLDVVRE